MEQPRAPAEDHVALLHEIADIVGPEVTREGASLALIAQALERRDAERIQPALAKFLAAHEARFAELSFLLRDDLDCLGPQSLALPWKWSGRCSRARVEKRKPDEALRARILDCTDLATLDRWIARAAVAASAEEVVG